MANSHTDLVCWQLADQLRQMIITHTADDTGAAQDERFTSNLRDGISSACRNQSEGFYKFKHREMRPYFNTARGSLGAVNDGIRDGEQRQCDLVALAGGKPLLGGLACEGEREHCGQPPE
jgi:23S rRNA-intervening sequence protein